MPYIGNKPGSYSQIETVEKREKIVATSNDQTLFTTSGYESAHLKVFLNGALLDPSDYVATNGTTITLVVGANQNDELTFISERVWTPSVDITYGVNGIVKANGTGALSAAVPGTDYVTPVKSIAMAIALG